MPTFQATEAPAAGGGRRRPASRHDRSGGFAMIELMLALAIISLLAALALPWARLSSGTSIARFEAQRVAAFLRSDRNAALRAARPVSTRLDVARRRLESGVADAPLDVSPRVGIAALPASLSTIRFFPDGRSTGGRLLFGSPGRGFAIDVSPETAAVRVGEF